MASVATFVAMVAIPLLVILLAFRVIARAMREGRRVGFGMFAFFATFYVQVGPARPAERSEARPISLDDRRPGDGSSDDIDFRSMCAGRPLDRVTGDVERGPASQIES
jgi:hypothetical protein